MGLGGNGIVSAVSMLVGAVMLQTVPLKVFLLSLASLLYLTNLRIDPRLFQAQVLTHFFPRSFFEHSYEQLCSVCPLSLSFEQLQCRADACKELFHISSFLLRVRVAD